MQAAQRREIILHKLQAADQPLSAGRLAEELLVSRQIIVGDVALLRAAGAEISATPRGYVLLRPQQAGAFVGRLACCHSAEDMERELNVIVDHGCEVVDVIVEHPIYGEITGPLHLASRYEVGRFVEQVRNSAAQPLSALTEGIHLHTVSCPERAAYDRICADLRKMGILLEE